MRPQLTIAIPTYQRADYLRQQLTQLRSELAMVQPDSVEVIVSDNCSADATPEVMREAIAAGLPVRYLRNAENLGSDLNIAQCFNEARGRYLLIMGDDDVLLDGVLSELLSYLERQQPGVILLRPFGYDQDFRAEAPPATPAWRVYRDAGDFLQRAGALVTLISACVIHKEILEPLDARQFVGGNLVQVHLVLRALLQSGSSASYEAFAVACKRNNSGGYAFSRVFVDELGTILDSYRSAGLTESAVGRMESRLLIGFHPYYVWRQLRTAPADLQLSRTHFEQRYGRRWAYRLLIKPVFVLPRPLAWVWGAAAAAGGRIATGELRRGLAFLSSRVRRLSAAPIRSKRSS